MRKTSVRVGIWAAKRRPEHPNLLRGFAAPYFAVRPYTGGIAGNNYVGRSRSRAARTSGTLYTVKKAMARPPAHDDAHQLRYTITYMYVHIYIHMYIATA